MDALPTRKRNRLQSVRYNGNGSCFVTIRTKDKSNLFWLSEYTAIHGPAADGTSVGAALRRPPGSLNANGRVVLGVIAKFDDIYLGMITVDHFVIMPNHVHLLLSIHPEKIGGRRNAAPAISSVINQLKGCCSKRIGFSCWQKSFHDHIVRDEHEYHLIWEYIDANPSKWTEDKYFIADG